MYPQEKDRMKKNDVQIEIERRQRRKNKVNISVPHTCPTPDTPRMLHVCYTYVYMFWCSASSRREGQEKEWTNALGEIRAYLGSPQSQKVFW